MPENRGQWGSRWGFILATVGSAIGLGNIWRFPTAVGQSGGGAFLFLYLVIIIVIGIPLMVGELTIGRKGKRNIVHTFKQIKPGSLWSIIGTLGVTTGFVVLSYYAVIAGWSIAYIFKFILGDFSGLNAQETADIFERLVSDPIVPLLWHGLFMACTIGIVLFGIDKGIEKASRILMPLLIILLVLLAVRSITLDGASAGIRWFFYPDFAQVNTQVILGALGQVFFSLSLGMGAIITYGSYLDDSVNIPRSSLIISLTDLVIAIVAGLIIIPAVFAFDLEPGTGPPLIFITLPLVFQSLPWGNIIGALFFLLLSIAAVTSAISLLEVVVAYFIEEFKWTRKKGAILIGSIIFVLGVPSSLSRGLLADRLLFGMPFLDFMDYLASTFLMPLAGLLTAFFIGWVWKPKGAMEEIKKQGVDFNLSTSWALIVRFVLPVVLSYILVAGVLR